MVRALTVAYPVRIPALQQPSLRRPMLRLVGGAEVGRGAFPFQFPPALPVRLRVEPVAPAAIDEQDAERWDGMA